MSQHTLPYNFLTCLRPHTFGRALTDKLGYDRFSNLDVVDLINTCQATLYHRRIILQQS
jgi:hypothetical protein